MADFQTTYNTIKIQSLRERCCGKVWTFAEYVMAEDPGVTNHIERLALAKYVMESDVDAPVIQRFMHHLAANPSIADAGEAATDSDISYVVETKWNTVAGV